MKKTITVIDYASSIEVICNQIREIFEDRFSINKVLAEEVYGYGEISGDMVLLPSDGILNVVKNRIDTKSEIAIMSRTISLEGFDKLKKLESDESIYLVDNTYERACEICTVVYKLGLKDFDMVPLGRDKLEKTASGPNDIFVFLDNSSKIKEGQTVNIGEALLDINTIIDISVGMDALNLLMDKDLNKVYREMVTSRAGLARILNRANRYDSQINVLFDNSDEGIIEFDLDRRAVHFNDKAIEILGKNDEAIADVHACDLIKNISFNSVYFSRNTIIDEVININEKDLIVSVYPLVNSGKFYGSLAIVKEFQEVEKKQHKIRKKLIGKGHRAKYTFDDIIGDSLEIRKTKEIAMRMAKSDSSVLIQGETGTGKELFAQAIHNESKRGDYQFVAVNCGALPENILESELFGYEEGAFTGARKGGKVGLFELAHRGTIFLDEIGEMPKSLQIKFLRVLQEKEIMRLGSDSVISVDIRVIAASNKKLEDLVKSGEFREDLFYRLKILPLNLPSLRERRDDILDIFDHFKDVYEGRFTMTKEAEAALLKYGWSGNIRELRNVAEYLASMDMKTIEKSDLPFAYDEDVPEEPLKDGNNIVTEKVEKSENIEDSTSVHDSYERIEEIFGVREPAKYIFVLKSLYEARKNRERIGRRSICSKALEEDFYISEKEVRNILVDLDKKAYIVIQKGRGGSILTEEGVELVEELLD
ncbi:Transcriptional regulator containing PAS, AAA-type ATPase, and DNA-binding Fis domains [Dethiosulfatibacter aminovorans DSM 17477]|uniref:Transcriptional regulator containing PAS, AAA-type ATPase, and DNA-binding Fis domains n=1 Tax=Dethiosulfatibacter aminovorans DSM 17477 TaxID=1121476 RepID=A0A1M6KMW4_9FIRM|nr:sigma 54-interacting transcriptional regulator [Dethiosulfatibacter aminovorans]SHJ60204.1 Transcriptional regulator containing PAS, AAA-type ATPase, and DNA-binding Fis domains [Dethiosulfatibacter aminovorans DSM 17477]